MILWAIAMMAAEPSAEAIKLGREIAEAGTLGSLLPIMRDDEVGKLLKDHPELSSAEQAELRKTADGVFKQGTDKLFAAEARVYAEKLSIEDLRATAAYVRSPAAKRMQAALPQVIGSAMQVMQGMDFKKDLTAAYCKQTGKLCPAQ